eukprot:3933036-Rhodomonas_salina.1
MKHMQEEKKTIPGCNESSSETLPKELEKRHWPTGVQPGATLEKHVGVQTQCSLVLKLGRALNPGYPGTRYPVPGYLGIEGTRAAVFPMGNFYRYE